jgi:hypothetical protein
MPDWDSLVEIIWKKFNLKIIKYDYLYLFLFKKYQ